MARLIAKFGVLFASTESRGRMVNSSVLELEDSA